MEVIVCDSLVEDDRCVCGFSCYKDGDEVAFVMIGVKPRHNITNCFNLN